MFGGKLLLHYILTIQLTQKSATPSLKLAHENSQTEDMNIDCHLRYTKAPTNLFLTCNQLRIELAGLYYSQNTSYIPLCRFNDWVEKMDCSIFPLIRDVRINHVCGNVKCSQYYKSTTDRRAQQRFFCRSSSLR